MNKTKKRIFGLLGLAIIAAITVFAAFLPAPSASAVGGTTVLRVRVLGGIPDVTITDGPTSVVEHSTIPIVTTSDQSFTYINEQVGHIVVTLHYLDTGGGLGTDEVIAEYDTPYDPGSRTINLNLDDYGYGSFIITVNGDGTHGADEDSIAFVYVPISIDAKQLEIDCNPVANYVYDANVTDHAILKVYTNDNQLIPALSNIPVTNGNFASTLPFRENDLEKGYYWVEIVTYNDYDEVIATAIDRFYYDLSEPGPGPEPGPSTTVDIEAKQSDVDEDPIANYSYDPDITDHAVLNVYTDDGQLITSLADIPVTIGEYTSTLPFAENGLEEAYYKVEIVTYDAEGNVIGTDIDRFYYALSGGTPEPTPEPEPTPKPEEEDDDVPAVPNTGLFTNLNISRADYVVTGLIIFFASAIFALIYITKKSHRR